MSVRPTIIDIQNVRDPATANALKSMKSAIEMITGRGHGAKPIVTLGEDANFYGIVQKINELIKRLQSDDGVAGGGLGSIQQPVAVGVPGPSQTTTLTGDVSGSGTTSIATTLATVITSGTAGSTTTVPIIVWDAKGRVTQITTATVTPGSIGAVSTASAVITGTATLTNATVTGTHSGNSSGTNTGDQTITLSGDVLGTGTAGVTTTLVSTFAGGGPVGSASTVPVVTWDTKGRVTALSTATVTAASVGAVSTAVAVITGTATLVNATVSGVTALSTATGFTIAGGTTSKTLTVDMNAKISSMMSIAAHRG